MIVSSALMIWKGLMVITGSESPIVVVLSGSMEPAFFRGDLLMLTNDVDDPIRAGDITVFKIEGRDIPIVHRVIKVHEKDKDDTKFLTKGDNNMVDDRGLYASGQYWLQRKDVVGRAKGFVPYVGMVTIIMNDYPKLKYSVLVFVIELNDRFLDVMDKGLWFVEFYAPWCAHCKQLMPVWELVGHALADKQSPVRVGKVDCTRFNNVASTLSIRGYPTIIFFRNGIQIPYEGERRKEDIIKFAEKCSGPVVDKIETKAQFEELLKSADKEPFFVFLDDSGKQKTSLQMKMWLEYENVADMLFTETRFFKANEREIIPEEIIGDREEVALIGFKESDYWVNFGLKDFERGKSISEWIRRERWPPMLQLSASNLHSVADSNSEKKLVLISIEPFDRLNLSTPSGSFYDLAKKAANNLRTNPELNSHFQFGWLEGGQIANGIVMGSLTIPRNSFKKNRGHFVSKKLLDPKRVRTHDHKNIGLVVFNFSSYEFFLSDDSNEQMTVHSLLLFLQRIKEGHVKAQGGRAWITRIKRINLLDMFKHQPILTVCLFGVPLAFFSIITYSICSADFSVDRDEVYPDDEELDEEEEEDEMNEEGPNSSTNTSAIEDDHIKAE
uniref:signal peptidase I n=1 Tax=Meloidogyne javanica TaxID=6303 RepID=A0A915MBY8_MELJA